MRFKTFDFLDALFGSLLGVLFVLVMNWMDRVAQRGDC